MRGDQRRSGGRSHLRAVDKGVAREDGRRASRAVRAEAPAHDGARRLGERQREGTRCRVVVGTHSEVPSRVGGLRFGF